MLDQRTTCSLCPEKGLTNGERTTLTLVKVDSITENAPRNCSISNLHRPSHLSTLEQISPTNHRHVGISYRSLHKIFSPPWVHVSSKVFFKYRALQKKRVLQGRQRIGNAPGIVDIDISRCRLSRDYRKKSLVKGYNAPRKGTFSVQIIYSHLVLVFFIVIDRASKAS